MSKLVVIHGASVGLEYPIRGDVVLGRDPRCQVLLTHREVSGQHARITYISDQFYIEDLGSRNGTYVNDIPIQRHCLKHNDEIRVGRTRLRFDSRPVPSHLKATDPNTNMTVEIDAMQDFLSMASTTQNIGNHRVENILKLLCNISKSIGSLSGIKSTLDEIAATLLEVFQHSGRVIILLTTEGNHLEPLVIKWRSTPDTSLTHYSETIVRKALSDKRAILTIDALSDSRFSSSQSVMDLRLRSLMCAPLVHLNHVLGVVELDTLESSRMFTEEDLNLLTGIVAQVAFAVANAKMYEELTGQLTSVVTTLTTMMGIKSLPLRSHAERVSRYSLMIARRFDLLPHEIEELKMASLLHDLGLVSLSEAQLATASDRSFHSFDDIDDEYAKTISKEDPALLSLYRSHPERAAEILAPIKPLSRVVQIILMHHEQYLGGGFPLGLSGDEISLSARILAVADSFDVQSGPPESPEFISHAEKAFQYLKTNSGKLFDPKVVDTFLQVWKTRMRLESRRNTQG